MVVTVGVVGLTEGEVGAGGDGGDVGGREVKSKGIGNDAGDASCDLRWGDTRALPRLHSAPPSSTNIIVEIYKRKVAC